MNLYNTFTNKVEKFIPINENEVKMYVCGPTVYNYIHIGNTRPIVVFDVLARYFKYVGFDVKYVQNFTDIDDKIIKKALEEKTTTDIITKKYIEAFYEDVAQLNLFPNILRPKVTENLDEINKLINSLYSKGFAYKKGNDVVFSIKKYNDYGKLSNQKQENLNTGVRIDVDNEKENPFDFVLWKGKKENEPYYESDFGDGRPGWHIECSAMINRYLGKHIDIHAGGQDLIFPHHENERAQSNCGITDGKEFCNFWLHNSYITVNSEKMSKSLGNFMLLRDVLKRYDGSIIRHFILTCHYRKNLNFSYDDLEVSKKTLIKLKNSINNFKMHNKGEEPKKLNDILNKFKEDFLIAIEDDLNTPKALSYISIITKEINKMLVIDDKINVYKAYEVINDILLNILGIDLGLDIMDNKEDKLIQILVEVRKKLREQKNYELSDLIREELAKLEISISDK